MPGRSHLISCAASHSRAKRWLRRSVINFTEALCGDYMMRLWKLH